MSQVESVTTMDRGSIFKNALVQQKLLSTVDELDEITAEQHAMVFEQYNMTHTYDEQLPIFKFQESITDLADTYRVFIIQGGTGCGKIF